jgi:CRP-like cAMP-binding protein
MPDFEESTNFGYLTDQIPAELAGLTNMFDKLRKYIDRVTSAVIPDEEFVFIEKAFEVRRLRKRQFLLHQETVCRCMAFVASGALRQYSIDSNGFEHITNFAIEDWWISDRGSLISQTPSMFQRKHNCDFGAVFPLAWLVRDAVSHSVASLSWNTDFHFFHSEIGRLGPGVVLRADEKLKASLTKNNAVMLRKDDRSYKFTGQHDRRHGVLRIETDNYIGIHQVSVGIGMSGSGTFAVQALPNCLYVFAPDPDYWVSFGRRLAEGSVLESSTINKAVQISFPEGVFSMNVTLNPDNTWTITPGKS